MQPIVVPNLGHTGVRSIFCENNNKPEKKNPSQKFMYGDPVGANYIRTYIAKTEPVSRGRIRKKKKKKKKDKLAPLPKAQSKDRVASLRNFQALLDTAYGV